MAERQIEDRKAAEARNSLAAAAAAAAAIIKTKIPTGSLESALGTPTDVTVQLTFNEESRKGISKDLLKLVRRPYENKPVQINSIAVRWLLDFAPDGSIRHNQRMDICVEPPPSPAKDMGSNLITLPKDERQAALEFSFDLNQTPFQLNQERWTLKKQDNFSRPLLLHEMEIVGKALDIPREHRGHKRLWQARRWIAGLLSKVGIPIKLPNANNGIDFPHRDVILSDPEEIVHSS